MEKSKSSRKLKFVRTVSSLALIGSFVFILIVGFTWYIGTVMAISGVSLIVHLLSSGGSSAEAGTGFFAVLVDGIREFLEFLQSIFD